MMCIIERKLYKAAYPSLFMAAPDFEAGLRSLRDSLRQIETLLAWQQLKQAEARPHQPPSFALSDSLRRDLTNEYSFFLFTSMQIHTLLKDSTAFLSNVQRQRIKRSLAKMESQLHSLDLHKRLC